MAEGRGGYVCTYMEDPPFFSSPPHFGKNYVRPTADRSGVIVHDAGHDFAHNHLDISGPALPSLDGRFATRGMSSNTLLWEVPFLYNSP